MRVEEKRVGSPGEGLGPPVEVFVARGLGEFSAVLMLQVLDVCGMLNLGVVDPGNADSDWKTKAIVRMRVGDGKNGTTHFRECRQSS